MQYLVTGGAGFLGSHLCDALLSDGHYVCAVDNLITGTMANLAHLRHEPRFDFVQHDICQPFDTGPVDYILNFASPASPEHYMVHGLETLRVGSHGLFNVLELAHKYRARFLQASTSECYGDPQEHPQTENYWGHVNPIGPRSVYDESKRFAEAVTTAYRRYHGVDTRLVRIFNTYGPRLQLNDGRVVSSLMRQAVRREPLTVFGDGSQTRSFCYVDDEVDGILRLAKSDESGPVNIGNPEEFTILECARIVMKVTSSPGPVRFCSLPQDDPKQRRPDITKARQLLGWEPRVGLEAGLKLSLAYFQQSAQQSTTSKPELTTVSLAM